MSIGTAIFSNHLVDLLKLPHSQSYYMAGLLYGMGKLLLYHYHIDLYKKIMNLQEEGKSDIAREEEILGGINHCDIAVYLLNKWKLDQDIYNSIEHYRKLDKEANLGAAVLKAAYLAAGDAGFCFACRKKDEKI